MYYIYKNDYMDRPIRVDGPFETEEDASYECANWNTSEPGHYIVRYNV